MSGGIGTAFVLGAGLGTRLRPLTSARPKPLVPIYHKPLITFAFDHLRAFGVKKFVVNTHHCPEAYGSLLGEKDGFAAYRDGEVYFRHEPVLLDTAGGIGNVRDLLGNDSFLVHNGDVLADLPLGLLIERHFSAGNIATLLLRGSGGPLHVHFNSDTQAVTDIRGMIGGNDDPRFLFTGIYILSPEVFRYIPDGKVHSVVTVFLDMIKAGERVGGLVCDEGLWFDLGTRDSYLEAHRLFATGSPARLSYALDRPWPVPVHPEARIGAGVTLAGACAIGRGAEVGDGASLSDSILWEDSKIASRSSLQACIVRDGERAEGTLSAVDI